MYIIQPNRQNIIGDKMTITFIRSVIIYVFVVMAVRVMGKRQVGELNPHELVITILISAIATVPLEDNAMPLANSLVPILIFISLEIIESVLCMKSLKFRNMIQGRPMYIIKDSKLKQNVLKKIRYTMDDLIDSLRQQGIFDIAEVENAIVETNGKISVQKKAELSPITPRDMDIKVEKAEIPNILIIDSEVVTEYFGEEKTKERTIYHIVKNHDIDINEIMMMSVDNNSKVYIIRRDDV